jgi:hypothetical protein
MAQVVEPLTSKLKTLSSNSILPKNIIIMYKGYLLGNRLHSFTKNTDKKFAHNSGAS